MLLDFNTIKSITSGASRIEETDGEIRFYRFTKSQEDLYQIYDADFYKKTFSSSGVKMHFKTNSTTLSLGVNTSASTSRSYFSVDVFSGGNPIGHIDNFSSVELPLDYTTVELELGHFSKKFDLGDGVKEITVYFPWSVTCSLVQMDIDDGAFVEPLRFSKKLLAFGDSITHGYDALRPFNKYITRLSDALDAEEYNKAIGGEIFFPALADCTEDFVPDYITVAYGTNDWSRSEKETFIQNCQSFYTKLCANYPDSKIFAITPIWRKDEDGQRPLGDFDIVEKVIRESCENFKNVKVICGYDFVAHDEKYFSDLRLHPNDEGFEQYFTNLYNEITK